MRSTLLFLVILHAAAWAMAQSVNLGTPPVLNFPKKKYKAGTQTWDIAQDSGGTMWFANNDGLLEFDGTHWRLHPLANRTIVRAVRAGLDGNIYVGGQGDFGYFAPDARGMMAYHSLLALVPEADRQFGDVWDVEVHEEGVFFRTDGQVFRYQGQKLSLLFPHGKSLFFMGTWHRKLVIQDSDAQLYLFEGGRLHPMDQPSAFRNGRISAILPFHGDTTLVMTIQDGIFYAAGGTLAPWLTQDDHFLKINRIYCAGLLTDGKIALGTSLNGLVTLDSHRRIVHQVSKKNGLQNNTVLSLMAPARGGVWVGLDNGIDFVDIDSPFSSIFPDGELQGTGYAAAVYKGKAYFGTNSGLYAIDWKPYYSPGERQKFAFVENAGGQVWSLNLLGERLLMGHHEGAFEVSGTTARKITNLPGIWRFVPWTANVAIAGHYRGLALFEQAAGEWRLKGALSGFYESSRLLARDARGALWMAHPYRGIYRIHADLDQLSVSAEFLGGREGLPSDLGNHLFQLGDRILYAGDHGIYDFDEKQHRFLPNEKFNRLLGEGAQVRYLRQDDAGNVWYVTDKETGVLLVENDALEKKIRKMVLPELAEKRSGGFPFILPVDAQNVFVATDQGFLHFNPAAYTTADSTVRIVLHEIRLKNEVDSVLFGGHFPFQATPEIVALKASQNALAFSFSATDYPGSELVHYAHYLEGAEGKWSDWISETTLAFNNLHPGDYIFHVKAQNQQGVESPVLSFRFKILPPWYASRWAFAVYLLMLAGMIVGFIYRQQKRFEQEKQHLQDQHQRREEQLQWQALRSEETVNRLQNEKLEAEVNHKTQELASATLHLVQKNEILNSIKDALEKLKHKPATSQDTHKEVNRIVRMMEQDASVDADWEHFSRNFDQVHSDFLKRLGEAYPDLSPNDYKLCAYLRINLSSKEIAALMNISVRGVEAGRYRLRKRLNLDTEVNLTEYMMRF